MMAARFLRHVCEYVEHHTRPPGRVTSEAMASMTLYSTEARRVRKQPVDSARGAENTRAPEPPKE